MGLEEFMQTILGDYRGISELLRNMSPDEIVMLVADIFEVETDYITELSVGSMTRDNKSAVYIDVLNDMKNNLDRYDWVYTHLSDENSRSVFTNIIRYRILPDEEFLKIAVNEEVILYDGEFISGIRELIRQKYNIKDNYPLIKMEIDSVITYIWEVPMVIDMIRKDYRYTIGICSNGEEYTTILQAIPYEQCVNTSKISRVVAMAPYERPWSNVELVKDCGLIPYILHINHGCDVSTVGAPGGEYPYAELVKGMKLEFLADGKVATKAQYMLDNGLDIDCLILRGCYSTNYAVAYAYKAVNPHGKIYLGLDANSEWMDRIDFEEPDFVEFMNNCDVIATSCTAMKDYLNKKWPWDVVCVPNGYYNLYGDDVVNQQKKENVILTVGRLGTVQKATDVLIEAFCMIADRIPEWKLRLVGNVEKEFEAYVNNLFEKNPLVKDRIVFTGPIVDRNVLNQEYKRAAVFALPSTMEGGTPNVIAEALNAGCVIAVTEFDAYEDAINGGRCGMSSPVGDVEGFADILYQLCTGGRLEEMSEEAKLHLKNFYDMEQIVGGVYERLSV